MNDVSSLSPGMPFMDPRSDDEIASTFYHFISQKKLFILSKMPS